MVRPARAEYSHSPASGEGHAVAVVAIAGAVYLVLAGKVLDAAAVAVVLVIIMFLKGTPRGALGSGRNSRPGEISEGDTGRIIFHAMDADTHRRIGRRA
jgi:hypothetical protein